MAIASKTTGSASVRKGLTDTRTPSYVMLTRADSSFSDEGAMATLARLLRAIVQEAAAESPFPLQFKQNNPC